MIAAWGPRHRRTLWKDPFRFEADQLLFISVTSADTTSHSDSLTIWHPSSIDSIDSGEIVHHDLSFRRLAIAKAVSTPLELLP